MTKILVEFDEEIFDDLVQYLLEREKTNTVKYLYQNSHTIFDGSSIEDIVEESKNFRYLESVAIRDYDKEADYDFYDIPTFEVLYECQDFNHYVQRMREIANADTE